jgi:hypothetical protein
MNLIQFFAELRRIRAHLNDPTYDPFLDDPAVVGRNVVPLFSEAPRPLRRAERPDGAA